MKMIVRVLLAVLIGGPLLVACSSRPPTDVPERKQQRELAPVDEKAQRDKAVATRIGAGMESLKANDAERARRHISRALELNPSSAEANNAMALYYRLEGDEKREEEQYRKALRLDSKFSQARNNYAVLLYRQGRYEKAIEQLKAAAEDTNYDQRPVAFLNLGRSYAKIADYDKAVAALQRSLRLDSQQAEPLLELADVYRIQGNYADAHSYLNAYLSRARQSPRSLWVGIRIEQALGNMNNVSSYELQLDGMFKTSPEYTEWQAWKKSSPAPVQADMKSGKGMSK
ncbi:MAG: type IV pilus biogenesis/stability protein PilW [Pseudomonadota bacterium]